VASLVRLARGKVLAPRPLASAAFRVPDASSLAPGNGQLPLAFPTKAPHLYVHEGARQALERRLSAAHPGPVVLSITDNRHAIISHKLTNGVLQARIHHMFLDAPRGVLEALVRYVVSGERDASLLVGDFIESQGARIAKSHRTPQLVTKGQHHDLLRIAEELNRKYFGGACSALITWGKRAPRRGAAARTTKVAPKSAPTAARRARASIKLGSYTAAERLIRIHPVLDRKWVPKYFLAFVVYHEMLHHMMPAKPTASGRLAQHPPEFRAAEMLFSQYDRAIAWERSHRARVLRA
jgi:hypothetical protein